VGMLRAAMRYMIRCCNMRGMASNRSRFLQPSELLGTTPYMPALAAVPVYDTSKWLEDFYMLLYRYQHQLVNKPAPS